MHIMEGFLPWEWCLFWTLLALPFLAYGLIKVRRMLNENPEQKTMLALSGAFIFVLSSLKLPSVTGSSSHPTGTGFSTMFMGVGVTSILSLIVLLFQAILLAHGGLTTLGANVFSMGIAGPLVAYAVFISLKKTKVATPITVMITVFLADFATYIFTSLQLALAFGTPETIISSFESFLSVFAITQIPLAIVEGILITMFVDYLGRTRPDLTAPLTSKEVVKA